jgi:hypothetical protein
VNNESKTFKSTSTLLKADTAHEKTQSTYKYVMSCLVGWQMEEWSDRGEEEANKLLTQLMDRPQHKQ